MNSPHPFTCVLSKHHALGNDFLVLNRGQFAADGVSSGEVISEQDWSQLARQWCDRRTGLGADGLLLLDIMDPTHLEMRLYNADGGMAEMSGNGIRCLVQAAYRQLASEFPGASIPLTFNVQTAAGERVVEIVATPNLDSLTVNDLSVIPHQGTQATTMQLSVDMGIIEDVSPPANWADLGCHEDRPVRHVSLGNPHSVVGVDDVNAVDLVALGQKVPQVNLEIVEPGPEFDAVTMRVHERGAGLTLACGTGACAVAEAAMTWGLVPASCDAVIVHMPGGDATVAIERASRRATLTGPATFVATVFVDIPVPA